LLFLYIIQTNN